MVERYKIQSTIEPLTTNRLVDDFVNGAELLPTVKKRKERKMEHENSETDGTGLFLSKIGSYPLLDKYQVYNFLALSRCDDPYVSVQLIKNIKQRIRADDQTKFENVIKDAGSDPRQVIFLCNLPLVVSIAKRYSGISLEDAIQEGSFGLNRAIDRFDRTRGKAFSTLATLCIQTAIEDAESRNSTIYVPINIKKGAKRAYAIDMEYSRERGRRVEGKELKDLLKTQNPTEKETNIELMANAAMSGVIRNPEYLHDVIEDVFPDARYDPERIATDRITIREKVMEKLKEMKTHGLCKQEIIVMAYRLGYFTGYKMTLEEAGDAMELSRERVRKIEAGALTKMNKTREEAGIDVSELRQLKDVKKK